MSFEIQKAFHDTVHEEFPYSPCYTASDYGPTDIAYCEYDPGMLGAEWKNTVLLSVTILFRALCG